MRTHGNSVFMLIKHEHEQNMSYLEHHLQNGKYEVAFFPCQHDFSMTGKMSFGIKFCNFVFMKDIIMGMQEGEDFWPMELNEPQEFLLGTHGCFHI